MINEKEVKKKLKNKTQFFDILLENTKDYDGKFKHMIVNAPLIYNLLCKLLDSKNLFKKDRHKISSTIAYFILPKDVFPEELYAAEGYIDDIYLSLHTINYIKKEYGMEELLVFWDESPELLKRLLEEDYKELDKKLNHILHEMLEYVGIH
jgi:uncharacterized membrane protein YkvA (DUF1232 family)